MDYKLTCIILYASQYSLENERREHVDGVSVTLLPCESLNPYEDLDAKARGTVSKGYRPIKDTAPYDMAGSFISVPGLYDVTMRMKTNAQGKGQMKLISVNYIGELKTTRLSSAAVAEMPAAKDEKPIDSLFNKEDKLYVKK